MSGFISHINEANFETEVIDKSHQTPVLVDFWADWCQPCKQLMPILEKIVTSFNGSLLLAKVDTDQHQQLAMNLGVRSLPTVLLFKKGQLVEQFSGVQPETEIIKLIKPHVSINSVDTKNQQNLQLALDLINSGQAIAAIDLLKEDTSLEGKIMLVKVLLGEGEVDKAIDFFNSFPDQEKQNKSCIVIKSTLELINMGQESNDSDLQEAISHLVSIDPEAGVEKLLLLLSKPKQSETQAIKSALIVAFNLFEDPKLVSQLRRKMAAIIF
jgi:putative thioredoxin